MEVMVPVGVCGWMEGRVQQDLLLGVWWIVRIKSEYRFETEENIERLLKEKWDEKDC